MSEQQTDSQRQAMQQITQSVMSLLDMWDLETEQMQQLLKLPSNVRARAFHKFREGREVLPTDVEVMRRAYAELVTAYGVKTETDLASRIRASIAPLFYRYMSYLMPLAEVSLDLANRPHHSIDFFGDRILHEQAHWVAETSIGLKSTMVPLRQ